MNNRTTLCVSALLGASAFSPAFATQPDTPPTAIYHNATVYTARDDAPTAQAIAITGDTLTAVGSSVDVLALAGDGTTIVNLAGRTVVPGLIDAHGHLAGLGSLQLGVVDLSGTTTYQQVIDLVRAAADRTPAGDWIIGRGWDNESWPDTSLPAHDALSEAVPDHPVALSRVDGHALLANRAAMDVADVSPETANPPGGEVLRDEAGNITGVFVDNAESLVWRAVPETAFADTAAVLLAAQDACFSAGLTGVHDMGVSPGELKVYQRLADSGDLKLRTYAVVSGAYAKDYFSEHGITVGDTLTVRATKLYADGAMGSRGAWLLEPYEDRPTDSEGNPYSGLAVTDIANVKEIAEHALSNGYQVCTHAIGDRANREVLNAYFEGEISAIKNGHDGWGFSSILRQARFRVEHAQLLAPEDISRFALYGVIPSMQPRHATSDMRWVVARVGQDRAKGAYAWQSLTESGAPIAAGSDFPVEPHEPLLGFYAAVTRQNADGYPEGGWMPDERLTRQQALRAFTINAAHAAFEEDRKGTLEPGKLADFVVLDTDIMTCEPAAILEASVLTTVLGGAVVFQKD